jgi:hypothetical protein
MTAAGTSKLNPIVDQAYAGDGVTATVEVVSGDEFCRQHGIEHISYLKVDTEGHDMEVLEGFAGMLQREEIDIVEVEAGMNPDNEVHVSFATLASFLGEHGYLLLRLYSQVAQGAQGGTHGLGGPHLHRARAAFISSECAFSAKVRAGPDHV